MCTAIWTGEGYPLFGRTLDIECSYGETVIVTPRTFPIRFLHERGAWEHPAMIGVGCVQNGTPLYYDAINEHGLAMAGLNFAMSAIYHPKRIGTYNVASFELIWWVLCQCKTVGEAESLLKKTNLVADSFSPALPATPLHWMIADCERSIVVESVDTGVKIYENHFGVLTNEPPFPYQAMHLCDYLHLNPQTPQNTICPAAELRAYSNGLGAMGLPGDFSSASRFVRAVFLNHHTARETNCDRAINRFFHLTEHLAVPKGCVLTERGAMQTLYTSCADLQNLRYYTESYQTRLRRSVSLSSLDLQSDTLRLFDIGLAIEKSEKSLHQIGKSY